jgi:hypothetical protein
MARPLPTLQRPIQKRVRDAHDPGGQAVEPAELRSVAGSLVLDSVLHSRPVLTCPPGGTNRIALFEWWEDSFETTDTPRANEVIRLLTRDACQSGSATGSKYAAAYGGEIGGRKLRLIDERERTGWDSNPRYPYGYTGFRGKHRERRIFRREREWPRIRPRSVGPRKEIGATFSRNSNLRLT